MSDFLRVMNQISTVANEVANIANQIAGRPVPPQGQPTYPQSTYPMPASMPQDTYQWSPVAYPSAPPPAPVAPAPSGGFMQVLSSLFSQIAAFFKRLFANPAAPAPAAPAPAAPAPTARVAMADAREQLFAMMPTGRATVMGFVSVTVSRHPDRLVISAGSFGSAAVIKQGGEYYFQENDKQPIRVQGVSSSLNAQGDMRFTIALENGKRVEAEILADGRTLRYDDRTLTLR